MPEKKEPEILPDGIVVHLDSQYWIKFSREWTNLEIRKFRQIADDLEALKYVVQKTLDWHLPDGSWNLLPFEKDKLLAQITAFQADPLAECFTIPAQLQLPIATAYYKAYGAACSLPFQGESASTA